MISSDQLVLLVAVAVATYLVVRKVKSASTAVANETWKVVGEVTGLWIYPLKSCKGQQIESGEAKGVGLANQDGLTDRWFTIRYAKNDMKVTAREEPTLLHISVNKLTNKTFLFTAPNQKELLINTRRGDDDEKIITTVFGDKIECYDAGDGAAEWISNYLNKPCRISFDPIRDIRQDAEHWTRNWRLNGQKPDQNLGSFADKYPFMLLGDDSLADINEKIPNKNYTALNFRPNITVKSLDNMPWAEDNWVGELHIGDAIFSVASPCGRCIFTTIDPETGERSEDGEPLKTLKTFRLASGKDQQYIDQYKQDPMVGVMLVLIKPGKIRVGDEIVLCNSN